LLLATDQEKLTAWQAAARGDRLEILKKIWDLAEEKLTTEEVKK
jgi:hypothetical protein